MATRPLSPQETTLFDNVFELSSLPEKTSDAERLESIRADFGFYPETHRELVHATALQSNGHSRHPATEFLGAIYSHQNKQGTKTNDPAAAVRSVANEMIHFMKGAKANVHFASEAQKLLNDNRRLINNRTSLANVPGLVAPYDASSARGYGQLVRYHDLAHFADLAEQDIDPLQIEYTRSQPDALAGSRIATVLAKVRFSEGLLLAHTTTRSQVNRYHFWEAQLQDAVNHPYAKPLAHAALRHVTLEV